MCHKCDFYGRPDLQTRFVRAVYFDTDWIHVWDLEKNCMKTEEEILLELKKLCKSESEWDVEPDEIRQLVGVDGKSYGFYVMKKL